jgi:hypothetical protein
VSVIYKLFYTGATYFLTAEVELKDKQLVDKFVLGGTMFSGGNFAVS